MSEESVVKRQNDYPVTYDLLCSELKRLGLRPKMTVLVHSSLSSFGWVCGGEQAVITALQNVITQEGTLILPAFSSSLSEPSEWQNPPVPESWWETIRDTMPAFEPESTPVRGVGKIPECFRKYEGVLRSSHPAQSFCAWGKNAEFITANHSLDFGFSEQSPLARIYELNGHVLLLGVGHDRNTSMHLGEARSDFMHQRVKSCGAPVTQNGVRVWKEYRDYDYDSDDFDKIGADFEKKHVIKKKYIAHAFCKLMKQVEVVDFAQWWIDENR